MKYLKTYDESISDRSSVFYIDSHSVTDKMELHDYLVGKGFEFTFYIASYGDRYWVLDLIDLDAKRVNGWTNRPFYTEFTLDDLKDFLENKMDEFKTTKDLGLL